MEAVEKAKYLVYKYYNEMNPDAPDCNISFAQAKQCALIAVDEILCQVNNWGIISVKGYWEQPKHELNKSE